MPLSWIGGLFLAVVALSVPLSPVQGQAARPSAIGAVHGVNLISHVAVYELSLARGDSAAGVVGLRGRLALELADACEGFTLTQRIRMQITNADGGQIDTDFWLSSWESRDGLRYRFALTSDTGGRRSEEYAGQAELQGSGGGGLVKFDKPPGLQLTLPAGTIFPTEHLAYVLQEAKLGRNFVVVKVFDGSGDDGVYEVSGAISDAPTIAATEPGDRAALAGKRAWRVRLAYFPIISKAANPQYEVGFRVFENGVSDELYIDYGDFAMKGALTKLELLPPPDC